METHTQIQPSSEEENRKMFKKFQQEIVPTHERDKFISNVRIAGENCEETEKDF